MKNGSKPDGPASGEGCLLVVIVVLALVIGAAFLMNYFG